MAGIVDDIRRSANNKYKEFLRSAASLYLLSVPQPFFPWTYKGSKGKKTDSYDTTRSLYSELYASSKEKNSKGYILITEKVNTRSYGEQTVVKEIVISNEEDYLWFIGKEKEYKQFLSALGELKVCFISHSFDLKDLNEWVKQNLDFLQEKKKDGYYGSLFSVLIWLMENRFSNLYIREIPLPVHTKFIEENEAALLSLYRAIIKDEKILSFEDTFGLRKKENLIRYRMNNSKEETGLRISDFRRINSFEDMKSIRRVYVVENEIVYLTFPLPADAMCIFGGGFASSSLSKADWLSEKEIYYFGDEDEHGFEILGVFRSIFPHVRSFLMDEKTYRDHIEYAVKGRSATSLYDSYLTLSELEVLNTLRRNPEKGRLEQERISVGYIKEHLKNQK